MSNNAWQKFHEQQEYERIKREHEEKRVAELLKNRPHEYISVQKERIEKTRNQGYLVDSIWPEGSIHIIAGPSGVGKSTWLLRTIHEWSQGKPILGFPSHPQPYIYIMCDRSQTDLQRTLDRLGLGGWDIKGYSIEQLARFGVEPQSVELEHIVELFDKVKVFFIEAFNWFYAHKSPSAGKDYVDVLRFWSHIRDMFSERDKTIIGTTHIPKMKKGDSYTRARDKVFGSVGQPAVAGTIMIMEDNEKNPDKVTMTVSARDIKEFRVVMQRAENNGDLSVSKILKAGEIEIPDEPASEDASAAFFLLDKKLGKCQIDNILTRGVVLEWVKELKLSEPTADRWIRAKVEARQFQKAAKGSYWIRQVFVQ